MNPCADVFAEIAGDGQTLILLGQGQPHELAEASNRSAGFTPLVKESTKTLGMPGGLTMPLTWPTVVQGQAIYGKHWHPTPRLLEWMEGEITRRTQQRPELWVPPPPGLVPRSYQVEAAAMMREVGGALLWDDPGTGKTISAILGLVERAATRRPVLPIVIVCPASVVDVWVAHIQQWAPFWRVVAWRGTSQRRMRLMHTADVYVASYGIARRDAGEADLKVSPLLALRPNAVVADECHRIKDQAAEQSKATRRLAERAPMFVGLSGTPITHNPGDIWPVLNALEPLAYPSRERWITRYCDYDRGEYSVTAKSFNHRESEYRLTVMGQSRRKSKADVATELPPKVYTVRYVDIPPKWRKAYDSMESDMLAELPDDGGHLPALGVLAKLSRLLQIASAPADVRITQEPFDDPVMGPIMRDHVHVTLKHDSWKVDELLSIMEERPGRPAITFAPSAQLIRLAGEKAAAAGYRVGYVIGGQSQKVRTETIAAFQAGALDLIAVTTGAGGVGITLTRSDLVVFLQRPWSIVEALQAEDRAHRIGAEVHESIEVIDIVTRKSIESRVRDILRQRAGSLSDFVEDPRIVAEILGGAGVTRIDRKRAS